MKYLILLVLFGFTQVVFAKFENQTELSMIQTGGNTKLETYNLSTLSKYSFTKSEFLFGGHYTLGTSEEENDIVEKSRNWDISAKYLRNLIKKLSYYTGVKFEGDTFAGYKQRDNYDLGLNYSLYKTDKKSFSAEIGYRYTLERSVTRNSEGEDEFEFQKGRVQLSYSNKIKDYLRFDTTLEYLPNFTESEDYQVNFSPSLAVIINDVFSYKTSYIVNYDNEPNIEGNEYTDYKLTTSIIAKF